MPLPQNHELLDIFRAFLSEAGLSKVSVKNYVSDVRKFLEWSGSQSLPTPEAISSFVATLQDSQVPHSTINRYLASLRRYSVFLKVKYEIDVDITPQPPLKLRGGRSYSIGGDTGARDDRETAITALFLKSLQNEDLSHSTVKNYKSDLNHFLSWSANSAPPSVIPNLIRDQSGSMLKQVQDDTQTNLADILSPSSIAVIGASACTAI